MDEVPRPPKQRPKPSTRRVWMLGLIFVGGSVWLLVAATRQRDKDTRFALYADLHNLLVSQTAYYTDHATYATDLTGRYRPMRGSRVRIVSSSDTSWSVTATHPHTSKVCTMSYSHRRGATKNQMAQARNAAMLGYVCK